ncbi:hypothetical protein [Vibrio gigantis]|uniref:hypothetical protein n=1 Tax=Vibrio gigantis TaxID=296199 RepID=UPI001BFD3421|nr:hypothetical protein [Vibrio gigantis]
MVSRNNINKVLLAVRAEKISQREWDLLKAFSEKNIAQALIEHRPSFEDVSDSIERLKRLTLVWILYHNNT